MSTYQNFEDLEVWKLSRALNNALYDVLDPKPEFSNGYLKNHLLKTAGSIMDNIAEGFEREGNKEFIQFLFIAKGSAGELRSQLMRAMDFNFITTSEFNELKDRVRYISRQLKHFIKYLKSTSHNGNKHKK
ncbi:four helix bundle protein [Lishizhenia tianjinensis]|uniref:Four helix bundle protein n=1 Tax=Lishizhenia tianjinensis TaxID=477690 RepID=A0A1I6ZKJ5_9FLAO|nr:four helix bundle protein [Lishizhenia tianjinensis]SFT63209.1 four helix bundle protein [Lishizhenia tianjinensis]